MDNQLPWISAPSLTNFRDDKPNFISYMKDNQFPVLL